MANLLSLSGKECRYASQLRQSDFFRFIFLSDLPKRAHHYYTKIQKRIQGGEAVAPNNDFIKIDNMLNLKHLT